MLGLQTAPGQSLLWEFNNPNFGGLGALGTFGQYTWPIKDCDGDGVTDILVSDGNAPHGYTYAGYVGIISGSTGVVLRDWHGGFSGEGLHAYGTVGDVNGDGAGDFAMQQYDPATNSFYGVMVSGSTGLPLPTSPNAYFLDVYPLGDLNNDGYGDFASTGFGGFAVFAGPAGAVTLQTHSLNPWQSYLGYPVVLIDDIDGDGTKDIFAGAPGNWCYTSFPPWVPLTGQAFVYSGATGTVLRQLTGTSPCDYFGRALAAPGDLNGDGITELIVGAPGASQYLVYSGANGALLSSHPYPGCPTGQCPMPTTSLGDINSDGYGDYAITIHPATSVRVYSGYDHSVIQTISSPPAWTRLIGWSLCALGDVDGDRAPDLAWGEPSNGQASLTVGRVRCYSLAPAGIVNQGIGCAESGAPVPRIGVNHAATSGAPFTINLSGVQPNVGSALILGLSSTMSGTQALPWDLGSIGVPGCHLYASMDVFLPGLTTQLSPGVGASTFTATIPLIYGSGVHFFAQWAVENPPGDPLLVRMTPALAITIQ